jgi:three-Cys-motif partner protein
MSSDSGTEPEVGPWAAEKLDALERYLDFYTKVLKNQRFKTIYLDAFAGGGRARIRPTSVTSQGALFDPNDYPEFAEAEVKAFVEGSPRRSLRIPNPFDAYIFIDADPARASTLEALKGEFPDRKITVRNGDAGEQIAWALTYREHLKGRRGVAFLDPFGAHLPWASVVNLAKTRVFEVLVNFPLDMCINRLLKRDADIPPSWLEQLNTFFPEDWWQEAYTQDFAANLFGTPNESEPTWLKRDDARKRLLAFYLRHLKAAFGHVSAPRLIRNTRGHPLYYLIWAGPHPAGLKGADYILSMGETAGGKNSRP